MKKLFPFTAIVGQQRMKRALILNAIDSKIGGVLIRGERGTAKTTAARALAALLPTEKVVQGCRFGCDPNDPLHWCTECIAREQNQEEMHVSTRETPFVNLPVSATEDRVVGTLDIERALSTGEKAFEPGILAAANRGLLYIDEVNLLEDHVVDLLLDVAATGINRIEREGISFFHPAQFILIGTMNPEEGDLRPQLLDRFAHAVEIYGIEDARDRVEIMKRYLAYETDPESFYADWLPHEQQLSSKIETARALLEHVRYSSRDLITIASLTSSLKVEGHRADLVILKTARAQAAYEGRTTLSDLDIAMAAELALPHRLQKGPFSEQTATAEELRVKIEELRGNMADGASDASMIDPASAEKKNLSDSVITQILPSTVQMYSHSGDLIFNNADTNWWDNARPIFLGTESLTEDALSETTKKKNSGKRSRIISANRRGNYFKARQTDDALQDLAVDATLRAAAPYQKTRRFLAQQTGQQNAERRVILKQQDFMRKVRSQRASALLLFLVDLSWSMAVQARMNVTRSAIFSLLTDAYQHRDRVGLITFQKDSATIVLNPTHSVVLAERSMKKVLLGGKTPLPAGLAKAHEVLSRERRLHPESNILLIALTDGAANVPMQPGADPMEESRIMAEQITNDGFASVLIDMDQNMFDQGTASLLAKQLKAPCYLISGLEPDQLTRIIRKELN